MTLPRLLPYPGAFTVCKVASTSDLPPLENGFFASVTDEEVSLVCPTKSVPLSTTAREDGWCAFRFDGTLDFSLIGILSEAADALKEAGVSIFAVSTFNTDYIFVKEANREKAVNALSKRFDMEN